MGSITDLKMGCGVSTPPAEDAEQKSAASDAAAGAMFDSWDKDKSGELRIGEVGAGLAACGVNGPRKIKFFKMCDKDEGSQGVITRDEFAKGVKQWQEENGPLVFS